MIFAIIVLFDLNRKKAYYRERADYWQEQYEECREYNVNNTTEIFRLQDSLDLLNTKYEHK